MMKARSPITTMIVALAGMIAWGLHFAMIYAITTAACLRPQSPPAFDFRIVATAMTAILIAVTAWCIFRFRQDTNDAEPSRFLHVVAASLGVLALAAVLWATLPIFFVTDCRTQ